MILDACQIWHLSSLRPQKLQKFQFWCNLKLYINRRPWINGGNFFCNFWCQSILIPVNVGTCQFLGQSYGPRTANASILMKFCSLNKSRVANSMVKIVFCDSWRLLNLTLVNISTCNFLGHIFKQELQELQFGEISYSAQIKDA